MKGLEATKAAVGAWVYDRIADLMDAAPGTPEAIELAYLESIAEQVEARLLGDLRASPDALS